MIRNENDMLLYVHVVVISENGRVKFFVKHEFSVCFKLFINQYALRN